MKTIVTIDNNPVMTQQPTRNRKTGTATPYRITDLDRADVLSALGAATMGSTTMAVSARSVTNLVTNKNLNIGRVSHVLNKFAEKGAITKWVPEQLNSTRNPVRYSLKLSLIHI